ncbi:hypothetical protein ACET3Z_029062 [Daucus carota]
MYNHNMYHGYGLMGYPVYGNSEWDGYHYSCGSDEDAPNLFLAGGASWSYDYDFAHSRIGTGVFIPKLDQGTGVFHPKLELVEKTKQESNPVNPDRVEQERYLGDPNRVAQKCNLANASRVDQESNTSSLDSLPDELQELVLTFLPLSSIIGSSCVCKKWKQIVLSGKLRINSAERLSKPWYFMFKNFDDPLGNIYDPLQRHWYDFKFPFTIKHTWKFAASSGLICMMEETDCNFEIYICNPMTRKHIKLEKHLGAPESTYSSLAFSVNKPSNAYTIAIVRSWQAQESFTHWNTSIHIYNSEKMMWLSPFVETLSGWRAGCDSIIVDGALYFVVTKIGLTNCHALLRYNLDNSSHNCNLIKTLTPIPFSLTCVRLMYLQNRIVMVGGLGSHDVPEKIGIWQLKGAEWEEVSWVPDTFFQGFGEIDDVFASSGAGDLIYIQAYGSTSVLIFDMKSEVWKWCQKRPLCRRYALELFSGFCFEPRLDISP